MRGGCCGDLVSVFSLDVGAFDFLLIILAQGWVSRPFIGFQFSGQIISVGGESVKWRIGNWEYRTPHFALIKEL